jgi:Enhancer of polycomb-like
VLDHVFYFVLLHTFLICRYFLYCLLAFGMDQEIPEYDMDSEDEVWLNKQVKHLKMDVPPIKFESMMDRLEKGSGQVVRHSSVLTILL